MAFFTTAASSRIWPTYDKGDVILDEEDEKELLSAFKSNLLFRYDYRRLDETPVGRFEKSACDFFNAKHALAVASGTTAIALALMGIGIKHGDEVALSGFTFSATASAIQLAGGKPVLIEVDDNLNLDVDDLRKKYGKNTKALVVVHMRGAASDMKSVMEFASSAGLPVVEDAVPAMGVKFKGKYLGTWGDVGAFSTQSDKSCNTGEGGLLITDNDDLYAKAVVLSGAYEGRWKKHFTTPPEDFRDSDYPIYGFRMDNLRGALAHSQMKKLPTRLEKLSANYSYLINSIKDLDDIKIREPSETGSILGDAFLFTSPSYKVDDIIRFSKELRTKGIECRAFGNPEEENVRCFWNWGFLFKDVKIEDRKRMLPKTSHYLEKFIDVSLSPTLEKSDIDYLVSVIRNVLTKMKQERRR